MNEKQTERLVIPEDVLNKWQGIVDIMSKLLGVPAGVIKRFADNDIEVLVSSHSEGNPCRPGGKVPLLGSGQYCETVIKTREKLLIPDALADEEWKDSPGARLGLISYLGFPIILPDGRVFGTICVLDKKKNSYSPDFERLMREFKELVESHLGLLYMNRRLVRKNRELLAQAAEIRTLRRIIPICSFCKNVRDDEGFWGVVEQYISKHSNADFSHSVCPGCAHEHYSEFMEEPDVSNKERAMQPL